MPEKEKHHCPYEREFGSIQSDLKAIGRDIGEIKTALSADKKDNDRRIRKLENWRYLLIGLTIGIPTIVSILWKFFEGRG